MYRHALSTIAVLATSSRAAAQSADPKPEEVIEIEEEWREPDLFTVGHTTRATSTKTLDQGRAAVLGDVLENMPGVAIQRTGPGQAAPVVRGFIGSAVLLVVDGMRVNNAIFRPAPNQYTSLIDAQAISRVEVMRGQGSALFGSDALAGVINVVTPLPRFEGHTWQREGTASVLASSADRSLIGRVSAAAGRDNSGVSIGTTLQRHGDLRSGGGLDVDSSAYDSIAADATGHLENGAHATTGWVQLLLQPSQPRPDEMNAGFGQTEPAAMVFRYEPSQRSFAHGRHFIRNPTEGLDGLELHAAWQRIDDDRRIRDTGSDEELTEQNRDDSIGLAARSVASVLDARVMFGADYWLDVVGSTRQSLNVVTGEQMRASGRFADGSTMHQLGGFGEASRRFGPATFRTAVRLGLTDVNIAKADREIGANVRSLNWAGELGAEVQLHDDVYALANAGRAFRAPNVQDLSQLGPRPGNRYQLPASDLSDEQALGGDVGMRIISGIVQLELFGFAVMHDNRIEVVNTGEMTADGREIVVSANTGRTRLVGTEVAARVWPHETLELLIASTVVYGNQDADMGREPADRLPPPSGYTAARWAAAPWLLLDAGVRGALAQDRLSERDRTDPRINPEGTPSFVTMFAGASYRYDQLEVALRADNLLDRAYREHGSGTLAPGFNASLLVRWKTPL